MMRNLVSRGLVTPGSHIKPRLLLDWPMHRTTCEYNLAKIYNIYAMHICHIEYTQFPENNELGQSDRQK